jgi:hypothetical protein
MKVQQPVKNKTHRPEPPIFAYTLKIGVWKKLFHPAYYKTLIANSLSEIVRKDEFKDTIAGYLISERRLCLILRINHLKVRKMLDLLYTKVSALIIKCLETIDRAHLKVLMAELNISIQDFSENIFKENKLRNDRLLRLLTGRSVELPYYDPQLQRLKNRLDNYPFSSLPNYHGGVSPVHVYVVTLKEWEERSRHAQHHHHDKHRH